MLFLTSSQYRDTLASCVTVGLACQGNFRRRVGREKGQTVVFSVEDAFVWKQVTKYHSAIGVHRFFNGIQKQLLLLPATHSPAIQTSPLGEEIQYVSILAVSTI